MEKGTAAPLAVALEQQLKGSVMARHINSWMQGKAERDLTFISFQYRYYRKNFPVLVCGYHGRWQS